MSTEVPEQFRNLLQLGSLLAFYPGRKRSRWGSLIGSLVFLLIGVGLCGYATYTGFTMYTQNGPALFETRLGDEILPPFFIGVFFGFVGVLLVWNAYANWQKGAALYKNGFAYRDRKGVQAWTFAQVTGMTSAVTKRYTNGIYSGTTHVYTLWNKENKKLVLNDALADVEDLANQVRQGIFPHLYQQAADTYNTGQPVQFGKLVISKANGIQFGKKSYPWDAIKEVTIQRGYLQIAKKDGGWFSGVNVAVSGIPNLEVFLSMVDQIIGIQ